MEPRYYRKVIRITAEDSPNVKVGRLCEAAGIEPTNEMVVEGVLPWDEFQKRLATWDEEEQCIGLWAQFYRGNAIKLFPAAALARAKEHAAYMRGKRRRATGLGIDSAEGGDFTVWTLADEHGLIRQFASKTPDTDVIPGRTVEIGRMYGVPPERWMFDRGGGGKQHADRLRNLGYDVGTVGFGEAVPLEGASMEEKLNAREQRYECVNMRAFLYYFMSCAVKRGEFAIPAEMSELHRQLSKIPRMTDDHGRMRMLPKRSSKPKQMTMTKLIGRSPDESDSAVLATYGAFQVVDSEVGALVI